MAFPVETQPLVNAILELPGLRPFEATTWRVEGSEKPAKQFAVFFRVDKGDHRGLYILARASDRRYWRHGHEWSITIEITDVPDSTDALCYTLMSEKWGQEALDQAQDLVYSIELVRRHGNLLRGIGIEECALPPFKAGDRVYYSVEENPLVPAGEYVVTSVSGDRVNLTKTSDRGSGQVFGFDLRLIKSA